MRFGVVKGAVPSQGSCLCPASSSGSTRTGEPGEPGNRVDGTHGTHGTQNLFHADDAGQFLNVLDKRVDLSNIQVVLAFLAVFVSGRPASLATEAVSWQ